MKKKSIAIVCDGKEISYGLNLSHIIKYKSEKEAYDCESLDCNMEMYTPASLKHSNISKKTIKILIGGTLLQSVTRDTLFSQFGISIYKDGLIIQVLVDPKSLDDDRYLEFIEYARLRFKQYYSLEKEYVDKVNEKEPSWIKKEFVQTKVKGLFGKKQEDKEKIQQQYDCASYILFLDFLNQTSEGKSGESHE